MSETEPPSLSSTITEELLSRYQQGDSHAMQRLFFRLRHALLSEVRNDPSFPLLRREHTEEDIVSELWTSLFARGSFDHYRNEGAGSLRAFIYRSLDCVIVDLVRRKSATKRGGGTRTSSLDQQPDDSQSPGQPASLAAGPSTIIALQDWVSACESKLDGTQALIWQLRVTDGLDLIAIGERLKLSDSTVRWHLMKARERLSERGLLPPP